jgi:serine/threonine protein kinase
MNGQLLCDRYKVISTLGAGGMGQTFLAEDTERPGNPTCVVKMLKPINNNPEFSATASRLFTVEAEILEKLGSHNQIPSLLACFEQGGDFYLVQEFVDGQPLSKELLLGQRWSEMQMEAMLKDILPVLEFIHAQGVIHRDIKPDNIIRRRQDGKLVLIDFGAVKQIQTQQSTAVGQMSMTVAIGTPGYMPTEQSSGKPRPSSDIYALGMIGIQSLTGLSPSQLREDGDGEIIWRDQADVSERLATVLDKMTRHYFKYRYQTATEVLQDLESRPMPASVGYSPTQVVNHVAVPSTVASQPEPILQHSISPEKKEWEKPISPPVVKSASSVSKFLPYIIAGLVTIVAIPVWLSSMNNPSPVSQSTAISAKQFIEDHYNKLKSGEYKSAWANFSDIGKDNEKGEESFSRYYSGDGKNIQLNNATEYAVTADTATIDAKCSLKGESYIVRYTLKFEKASQSWKIDAVKKLV